MWSAETYIAKIHFFSQTEKKKIKDIFFYFRERRDLETFSLQSLKPIRFFLNTMI